jgi:hypothetical protein
MPIRQYGQSFLVNGDGSRTLELTKQNFNESWLQEFIFNNPRILPIHEIEPAFGSVIPACRELITEAGPIDMVFVNELGLLTLVECKLWKNPEARRAVVGQILDYAKEISRWDYDELNATIKKSRLVPDSKQSLFEIASSQSEDLDESEFVDNVSRNLKRGRFLLLIVGNGIRESVERIAEFLQEHAHLNFSFSLVEMAIYDLPPEAGGGHLVQPRVIVQTVEVERAIIRIEGGQWSSKAVSVREETTASSKRRTKVSEQQFFEDVALQDKDKESLHSFLEKARNLGLNTQSGDKSLKLKFAVGDDEHTFGVFRINGTFQNYGIALTTSEIGHPEIGENYLNRLAALLDNTYVYKGINKFQWTVKKKDNQPVSIIECLAITDEWLQLIEETINYLFDVQGG